MIKQNKIFSRKQYLANQKRWKARFSDASYLFEFAEKEIIERLKLIKIEFSNIGVIGNKSCGILDKQFTELNIININDDEILECQTETYDLIISIMELDKINDIDKVLLQIKYALKKGGLFLGVIAGSRTLHQLKSSLIQADTEIYGGVNQRIHPFMDLKSASSLIQNAGFSAAVIDSEIINVSYINLTKLIEDIRFMGESNCTTNKKTSFENKRLFKRLESIYQDKFSNDNGEIMADFELIFLSGWSDD